MAKEKTVTADEFRAERDKLEKDRSMLNERLQALNAEREKTMQQLVMTAGALQTVNAFIDRIDPELILKMRSICLQVIRMKFDDLTEESFLMFAMREYNNMQCTDIEEFYDDLKKIKYIKRLFNIYKNDGQLKERLILNHLITWYNVFPVQAGTRILFYKIEEQFWPMLKTFLIFLDRMPDKIESIRGKTILSTDIKLDDGIVTRLRTIKV